MSYGLKQWALDCLPLVAREVEARVGRPQIAARQAEWIMVDCLCAFDAMECGGAGLAAFGELVAFIQDARLPWPERLADYAMRQDLGVISRGVPIGAAGFEDGIRAIRQRLVDHIRAVAVSEVLRDDETNKHLASDESRDRFVRDYGSDDGEALWRRINSESPIASPMLRAAAEIAADRLRDTLPRAGPAVFPVISFSGEALYRSAKKVFGLLDARVNPDGDLGAALAHLGNLAPGPYYVPRPETLRRLGIDDLRPFPDVWIKASGPRLPSPLR